MIGFPKLGASASRTFLGTTLLNTFGPKYSRVFGNLPREIQPRVVHGQQHAVDAELFVGAVLNPVDGIEQLGEAFEGVVLALKGESRRASAAASMLIVIRPSEEDNR